MIRKITIILFGLFFMMTLHLWGKEKDMNNFEFVARSLSDSLKNNYARYSNYSIVYDQGSTYSDLFQFINRKENSKNKINVEKTQVKIIYIPYRKFPMFKKKWVRKVYFKTWIWENENANNKKLVNWIFEDKIEQEPVQLENENWDWCLGKKKDDKEQVQPQIIEPVLAISASLVIILSLFYIRS